MMSIPQGLFVALEGGEGAGKSTLIAALAKRITNLGRDAIVTREPGGTALGETMRDVLRLEGLAPWAEALAFLAARAQLVSEVIRPGLEEGNVILCDRFAGSTFAYQGHGRGLDLTHLKVPNRIATGALEPDLTILLDLDPEIGLARKAGEQGAIRTGEEPLEFHVAVREGFAAVATAAVPGSWVTINAEEPPDKVEKEAWKVLAPRMGGGRNRYETLPGNR